MGNPKGKVFFAGNGVGVEGAQALAAALEQNKEARLPLDLLVVASPLEGFRSFRFAPF